jgi:drug/metabolite transporter (DMT)-like permease
MNGRSLYLSGVLFTLFYVVMCAVREVCYAAVLHRVGLATLLSITFSLALVAFSLPQLGRLRESRAVIRENWRDILIINFTTATMWVAFITALRYVEPAVVSSLNSALGPLMTMTLGFWLLSGHTVRREEWLSALGILAAMTLLAHATLSRLGSAGAAWGLFCCLVSGAVTAINNIVAKRLSARGLTPSLIMAVRFVGLVLGSLLFLAASGEATGLDPRLALEIALLAFLGIVIPLYCLQIGIARIDVGTTALLIAIGPLVTLVFQTSFGGVALSVSSAAGIGLAFCFVLSHLALRLRRAA